MDGIVAYWKKSWADLMPLIGLLVLCLITALLSERFLSAGNIANVLVQASVLAVVAMGMTYVIISGGFDLSVGAVAALSGVVAAMVMLETNIVFGAIAGVLVGMVVGAINGLIVTQIKIDPFITTLGTMVIVRGAAMSITDGRPITGIPEIFIDYSRTDFLGIDLLIWTPAVLFVFLFWVLHLSPYGRRLFACGGNKEAAFLAGINVRRVTTSAYIWCGALAGIAGVMLASRLQSGQPTAGMFYELTAIAAVVLGGANLYGGEGKLYNSLVGILILVVLSNSLNLLNVGSHAQDIATGIVILVAAAISVLRARRSH